MRQSLNNVEMTQVQNVNYLHFAVCHLVSSKRLSNHHHRRRCRQTNRSENGIFHATRSNDTVKSRAKNHSSEFSAAQITIVACCPDLYTIANTSLHIAKEEAQ